MLVSAVFAFLHFLAVFGVVTTLVLEWQTLSPTPSHADAIRLQRYDRWYGIFAVLVLIIGLLRVYCFEKGADFYWANPFFIAKLALFLAVGLLSIYPTIRFIKWRAQTDVGHAPTVPAREYRLISGLLRAELLLVLGVALCASLMAHAVGM